MFLMKVSLTASMTGFQNDIWTLLIIFLVENIKLSQGRIEIYYFYSF